MTGSGGDRGRMYRCRARALYGRDTYPGVVVRAEHIDAAVEVMWLSHVTALDHSGPGLDAIVRRWSVLHNPERDAQREELMAGLDAARPGAISWRPTTTLPPNSLPSASSSCQRHRPL
jgi:hypothetical protein